MNIKFYSRRHPIIEKYHEIDRKYMGTHQETHSE